MAFQSDVFKYIQSMQDYKGNYFYCKYIHQIFKILNVCC